jgi:hypothetical protein
MKYDTLWSACHLFGGVLTGFREKLSPVRNTTCYDIEMLVDVFELN